MKDMHCRDAGIECGFVAQGETEDDVKRIAAAHAYDAHGLKMTPDVEKTITSLIHDSESDAHRRSTARVDPHLSEP